MITQGQRRKQFLLHGVIVKSVTTISEVLDAFYFRAGKPIRRLQLKPPGIKQTLLCSQQNSRVSICWICCCVRNALNRVISL